jgi:hypothetical protein
LKWIGKGIKTLHAHPELAQRVLRNRVELNSEHLKWIGKGIKTLHAHPELAQRVLRNRVELDFIYKLEKLHDIDIQKSGTYFRVQLQRVHDELEAELDGATEHDKAFHANESLWWTGEHIRTLTQLVNDFD